VPGNHKPPKGEVMVIFTRGAMTMRALSLQEVEWVSGGGVPSGSDAEAATNISDTAGSDNQVTVTGTYYGVNIIVNVVGSGNGNGVNSANGNGNGSGNGSGNGNTVPLPTNKIVGTIPPLTNGRATATANSVKGPVQ